MFRPSCWIGKVGIEDRVVADQAMAKFGPAGETVEAVIQTHKVSLVLGFQFCNGCLRWLFRAEESVKNRVPALSCRFREAIVRLHPVALEKAAASMQSA